MSIYQRYLANQTPTPLNLVPPEDIADMGVDYDGNFVCSGGMRILPVWTSDPQSLCQQSEMQQQPSGNPFDQSFSRSNSRNSNLLSKSRKTATV